MIEIITSNNYESVDFQTLTEFVGPIYLKEVPQYGTDTTHHLTKLEDDLIYFSNNYAFIAELWAIAIHSVRTLRHTKADKAKLDEAMDKRDYLDRVLSATKLKYHAISRLMQFYTTPGFTRGY